MIMVDLTWLWPVWTVLETESDSWKYAPLVLCLSGFIFYFVMYMRYRNADKRHHHESETDSVARDIRGYDTLVKHRKGLSNSSMQGANDSLIEGALNTGGAVTAQIKARLTK